MKALITHVSLNHCGGGERVAIAFLETLLEMGFEVDLATVEKTDWSKIESLIGYRPSKPVGEKHLIFRLPYFGIYQRLLHGVQTLLYRNKYDITVNTHGDMMIQPTDITYMHFPTMYLDTDRWSGYIKYRRGFWRLYYQLYKQIQLWLSKNLDKTLLLTNSRFTASAIKKYLGRKAIVVYPPIDINKFYIAEKEDLVVTISRFSHEKNLHLLPEIARANPDLRFILIGSISNIVGQRYYESIKREAPENLVIHPNLPEKDKIDILAKAKYLLHLYPYEHFGIVGVEAQASGALVITHRSGGLWMDIADHGKYGVAYDTLDTQDISQAIEKARSIWNPSLPQKLRNASKRYTHETFKQKIHHIIKKMV